MTSKILILKFMWMVMGERQERLEESQTLGENEVFSGGQASKATSSGREKQTVRKQGQTLRGPLL